MTGAIPTEVAAAIDTTPNPARLLELRALILRTAASMEIPITETLKWGQPAYLPPKRDGTTIRLGATDAHTALYVHCQTTLIDQYRARFPTEFGYQGNREVALPHDQPLPEDALAQVIALALTYHRNKRAAP